MAQVRTAPLESSWVEALDRIRAFVAARVHDDGLAADITHDVVVRSIASGALDRVDDPIAWLYRSARNAVIDHYRTHRVHESLVDGDAWPDPDLGGDEPNAATRELARCMRPLLDQLAPQARDALERVDIDRQTHRQAAAEIGISVSGMKSRVQRARHQLRGLLEQCCTVGLDAAGAVTTYRRADATSCGCCTTTPCSAR